MTALITTVFIASLIGSLHCAGMCGGIVTLSVSGRPVSRRRDWAPHVLYNLGRLGTYAALGFVSGLLGAAIDIGGAAVGWSRTATLIAGAGMIMVGLVALLRTLGVAVWRPAVPDRVQALFQRGLGVMRRLPTGWHPAVIGLLTGLLPCGWLYAFVISAAGTGSPWLGALIMTAFWAGTVPVLLVLGVGVQKFTGALRPHVPRLTAAALMVVGVVTIVGRLNVPTYADAAAVPVRPVADVETTLPAPGSAPCCDGPAPRT